MKFDNKDSMGRDHQFKEDWLFVTLVSSKGAQVKFQPYFKFNKKSINFIKTMVESAFENVPVLEPKKTDKVDKNIQNVH